MGIEQLVYQLDASLLQLMDNNSTGGWSVQNFLTNTNSTLRTWGGIIVSIIGVVMVIVAIFNIGKGLMGGGRGQVNWVLNIILFLVGGALAFGGGWGLVESASKGGSDTLNQLGTGQAIIYEVDDVGTDAVFDGLGIVID